MKMTKKSEYNLCPTKLKSQIWLVAVAVVVIFVENGLSLNETNVCTVKHKYSVTKLVRHSVPMTERVYNWCYWSFLLKCTSWVTKIVNVTRLETDEREGEMLDCCPGYKMKNDACVAICPFGKTGPNCTQNCSKYKWGPNCAKDCEPCTKNGLCSPITGKCVCRIPWEGESCEKYLPPTPKPTETQAFDNRTAYYITTKSSDTSNYTNVYTTKAYTTVFTPALKNTSSYLDINNSLNTVVPTESSTMTEIVPTESSTMIEVVPTESSTMTEETEITTNSDLFTSQEILTLPSEIANSYNDMISTTTPVVDQTSITLSTISMTVDDAVPYELDTKSTPVVKQKHKEIWIKPAQKEPEHITAVADNYNKPALDLTAVITIAVGIMVAVITIAIVIVMIERCKKRRCISKKGTDTSIYTTRIYNSPLPDPPTCHYQPLSTLDRNLKQFMRPIISDSISPIMLENFRGILECHYDHLPIRNPEFNTIQMRQYIPPSSGSTTELLPHGAHPVNEASIEALKREAKFDMIDSPPSEPLYSEIPYWRPPSEHAVEIINYSNEAVTEL